MTNAGWYPDPAGAPDTYRYWDGQSWSQMTTTQPPSGGASAPAQQQPPAAQPPIAQPPIPQSPYGALPQSNPNPGGYPQPDHWSPQPGARSGGGGAGKLVGLIVAGVLALVLVGVGGFFGVRALAGDDGDKKADDNPSESDKSSDSTTDTTTDTTTGSTVMPTGIQCTGGSPDLAGDPTTIPKTPKTITGGGLTIPRPSGFELSAASSGAHSFADQISVLTKLSSQNWIFEHAVGGLAKANNFTSPDQAAEIVMQCLTSNGDIYEGFDTRTDLSSEALTVDGKPAYRITSEIRVKNTKVTVEGDVTSVIVVDTGNAESYGLYIGVATIGDQASIDLAERVIAQIKVG